MESGPTKSRRRRHWIGGGALLVILILAALVARDRRGSDNLVAYRAAVQLEPEWGRLVAVANVTMHGRRIGADRLGFFRAADGTIWGLPLAPPVDAANVLACAPADLRNAPTTDTLATDDLEVLGASDFASYSGSGSEVYLLTRARSGALHWRRVAGSEHVSRVGTTCRERPHWPGPHRDPLARYHYFRLMPAAGGDH